MDRDIMSIPRKRSPNPRTVLAADLCCFLDARRKAKKPRATKRAARRVILGKAKSWPRKVEPSSAPRVTARLCRKVMSPAPTRTASRTLVAEEDWFTMVTPRPVR